MNPYFPQLLREIGVLFLHIGVLNFFKVILNNLIVVIRFWDNSLFSKFKMVPMMLLLA
jgi:hypothetical protein